MLQAAHAGPISAQELLPSQSLFLLAAIPEGHNPEATHRPLQMTEGALHAHVVGLLAGEAWNPFVQKNPQTSRAEQTAKLLSG